jgi:hypothetical protein
MLCAEGAKLHNCDFCGGPLYPVCYHRQCCFSCVDANTDPGHNNLPSCFLNHMIQLPIYACESLPPRWINKTQGAWVHHRIRQKGKLTGHLQSDRRKYRHIQQISADMERAARPGF